MADAVTWLVVILVVIVTVLFVGVMMGMKNDTYNT